MEEKELLSLIGRFDIVGTPVGVERCHSGHINKTYIVTAVDVEGTQRRYILQRINSYVFPKPQELMHNIRIVTDFLRRKIAAEGGDPDRETLTPIPCGRELLTADREGGFWRVYAYVAGTRSYDTAQTPEMLENAGFAFGKFQQRLSNFPAEELFETLPFFHDTVKRFGDFRQAVMEDKAGRAASVREEIAFVTDRAALCSSVTDRIADGSIPLRVTHNDTKLNNVLIDAETGRAVCVVDLDTVMPGSVLYDFGDGIRFGASSAAEDETDPDRVYLRLDLFEAFTRGFLSGCNDALTDAELSALPIGAQVITFETGMRFLTDYLNGDVYFSVDREGHNLDRARTQFRLVLDMEEKLERMKEIVSRCRRREFRKD